MTRKNQTQRKQKNLFHRFPPTRKEHGGILCLNKRRSRRPLAIKQPLHITLRSEFAYGRRSLLKHRRLIDHVTLKASRLFGVKVYRKAICGNHLHFLVRGRDREALQNFFRVLSGHIAQAILREFPITESERTRIERFQQFKHSQMLTQKNGGGAPARTRTRTVAKGCAKNQRKFWGLLLYSRVVAWGRDFFTVRRYILQNTLEALHLIAYQPRRTRFELNGANTHRHWTGFG